MAKPSKKAFLAHAANPEDLAGVVDRTLRDLAVWRAANEGFVRGILVLTDTDQRTVVQKVMMRFDTAKTLLDLPREALVIQYADKQGNVYADDSGKKALATAI